MGQLTPGPLGLTAARLRERVPSLAFHCCGPGTSACAAKSLGFARPMRQCCVAQAPGFDIAPTSTGFHMQLRGTGVGGEPRNSGGESEGDAQGGVASHPFGVLPGTEVRCGAAGGAPQVLPTSASQQAAETEPGAEPGQGTEGQQGQGEEGGKKEGYGQEEQQGREGQRCTAVVRLSAGGSGRWVAAVSTAVVGAFSLQALLPNGSGESSTAIHSDQYCTAAVGPTDNITVLYEAERCCIALHKSEVSCGGLPK